MVGDARTVVSCGWGNAVWVLISTLYGPFHFFVLMFFWVWSLLFIMTYALDNLI